MKYLIGGLVAIVLCFSAYWGFSIYKDNNTASNSNSSDSSTTSTTTNSDGQLLDLSDQGITTVGPEVYNKTNTTVLILSNNSIKSLPSEMGKMTKLVTLKINNNILEGSLIAEVRQMSKLQTLDVSNNNMTGMPAEIGQLSQLQVLNYSNNNITDLPNELTNLKPNLKTLDLTGNPISQDKINKLRSELPDTNILF